MVKRTHQPKGNSTQHHRPVDDQVLRLLGLSRGVVAEVGDHREGVIEKGLLYRLVQRRVNREAWRMIHLPGGGGV